jgi:hypothetical protein
MAAANGVDPPRHQAAAGNNLGRAGNTKLRLISAPERVWITRPVVACVDHCVSLFAVIAVGSRTTGAESERKDHERRALPSPPVQTMPIAIVRWEWRDLPKVAEARKSETYGSPGAMVKSNPEKGVGQSIYICGHLTTCTCNTPRLCLARHAMLRLNIPQRP